MHLLPLALLVTGCVASAPAPEGPIHSGSVPPSSLSHPHGMPGEEREEVDPHLEQRINRGKGYLAMFGYLKRRADNHAPTKYDIQMALLRFQLYHGIYRSGKFDPEVLDIMDELRCGHIDLTGGTRIKDATNPWKKSQLHWAIQSPPHGVAVATVRQAAKEAFSKWKSVLTGMNINFSEGDAKSADITIAFEALPMAGSSAVVARASPAPHARIALDKERKWTFHGDHGDKMSLSLFTVLMHQIGHVLGLQHSFKKDNTMYPIFQTVSRKQALPTGPNIDRKALDRLHGIPDVATPRTKCPKQLESLTAVTPSSWLLFNDGAVWQIDNQRIDKASKRVEELFPEGPDFVNASVTTSKGKTLLIAERTIYGYEWQGGHFRPSSGFPKSLHERVLFFPQAAIPMNNGSVVLISGNVFAMYDPETNLPQYLNDVTRYLPGLPEEIRSGVPKRAGSDDAFYVFDANNMYDYDQRSHSVRAQTPITEFFKCS